MARDPKNYDHLLGKLKGISDNQLKAHFGLYQGYVKKLNEIWDNLKTADRGAPNYSFNAYSELKRREPVAFNGTVLHEQYFENLCADGTEPSDKLRKLCSGSFGTWDDYIRDVKAGAASAHGWVLTVYDSSHGRVLNNLVQSEHHVGLFPNCKILLAFDCWEHAYMIDHGTKKPDYVAAFVDNINWKAVNERAVRLPD
jgi:Fe-Mn family superoxide dismutase